LSEAVPGAADEGTLSQFIGTASGRVPLDQNGKPLAAFVVNGTQGASTYVHEMLHVYTGLSDLRLAAALGITDHGMPIADGMLASFALGTYFDSGCTDKTSVIGN
jgi:hypothetical protein